MQCRLLRQSLQIGSDEWVSRQKFAKHGKSNSSGVHHVTPSTKPTSEQTECYRCGGKHRTTTCRYSTADCHYCGKKERSYISHIIMQIPTSRWPRRVRQASLCKELTIYPNTVSRTDTTSSRIDELSASQRSPHSSCERPPLKPPNATRILIAIVMMPWFPSTLWVISAVLDCTVVVRSFPQQTVAFCLLTGGLVDGVTWWTPLLLLFPCFANFCLLTHSSEPIWRLCRSSRHCILGF